MPSGCVYADACLGLSLTQVTSNNKAALMTAVASTPTVFYMYVGSSFQSYAGGVYNQANCTTSINHA